MSDYYLYRDEKFVGPFSKGDLIRMTSSGEAKKSDQCMSASKPEVQTVADAMELPGSAKIDFRSLGKTAAPVPAYRGPARNRGVYIILGLLLGGLGCHNFYAGYYERGALQCFCVIVGAVASFFAEPAIIIMLGVAVWVLVELFIVTEDAGGQPMY